ncbi:MAG: sugar phosphate isomerase/epimerase [Clostridiales bacterium]|nr:sugar phosphate isomerase/epimerase [Clostridiales bacterium]
MEYGMPTLIELPKLENCAALCRKLGLQFIELNMNLPQYQPEQIDIARFREIAEKYGVYYTIHLDENLNVSDFNHRVAKAYLDTVAETIDIAKALHAPVLNMHLSRGVYFTLPDRKVYLFAENEELYLNSMRKFRDMAETLIGGSDIKICIENCDGYTDFQIKALDLLLESPVFALTFDIGHNHGIGGTDEPVIMSYADRLSHMHMHDALGKQNHLSLGDGEVDLHKYFTLADKCDCRVVLETKTVEGLKKSVKWIERNVD